MTDGESQTDEICALESIFTEEEFKNNCESGVNGGQFNAFVTVPDSFTVVIQNSSEEDANEEELRINVKYLPPIEILFTLPPDYPSQAPPWFVISCPWLTKELLTKLCEELDRLWEENKGMEVLFIWLQFLKEESLSLLGIKDTLILTSVKLEKDIKQEKHDSTVPIDNFSDTANEKLFPGNNLCQPLKNIEQTGVNCNNDLLSDTKGSRVNSESSSKRNYSSCKDPPQEKFSQASGEFSGDSEKSRYFYSQTNLRYRRRRYPNNYGAGKSVNYENSKIPQEKHYNNSGNNYHVSNFDSQRRNSDTHGSQCYENPRRYEKRKPRLVDSRNDHKPNIRDHENGKYYNRRKSPVERKISDSSFKKTENAVYDATFSKTDCVHTINNEGNAIPGSLLNQIENITIDDKNPIEDKSLEGKRLFEKNKKYQKNYCDRNNKETFVINDNKSGKSYRNDEYHYGSQGSLKNRYQVHRGKNRGSKMGQFNNNIQNKNHTKIGNLVENVSVSGGKKYIVKDNDNKGKIVKDDDNIENKLDVSGDLCSTKEDPLNKLTEESSSNNKKGKERIGRSQNHHKMLHLFLQSYNKDRLKMEFRKNTYMCNICFQDKQGMECTQFTPCGHVFCQECVTGYFEVRIKDGAVHNIMCPENKCTSEATQTQIREMVSTELFARYDSILLSTTLDTMCDIVYCPRPSCQYPTSKEEGSKMARCPACNYAFCIYCKMVYHGVEACRLKNAEKKIIFDEYQNADSEKKLFMEQKYGKKELTMLLQTTMSEVWINDNSKKCPHCNAAIEKSDGCNKMVCGKCSTFFCWLCEVRLDPVLPYKHYYDSKSRCYNLLFEGMQFEDNDMNEFEDE